MDCPGCHHANPDAARFCVNCGAPFLRQCPACGAAVVDGQKFCSQCGQSLDFAATVKSAVDEGERRQVTVVFSDLSGYTSLNERLDPEEVEAIMGRIKGRATEIVEAQSGTVNQFIGDEIMMLFGVPTARRDDPHRAVRAALELHRAVREIAAEVAPRIGRTLTMHTGINTGLIVVRRSDSRDGRFAVTGDSINTGARLLGLAGADEIVVGQETWRQISSDFNGSAGGPIEVKGKERPIIPYRVRGERNPGDASRRPLVGRSEEMQQFTAMAQTCLERKRGRLILLRGDPGIGKSRLGHEFLAVAQGQGFACHSVLVLDFSAERGRDTIRSLVRSLLSIEQDADEDSRRAAIRNAIEDRLEEREHELFLCDLLDVPPPAELRTLQSALPEQARDKGTLETLCELVRRASRRRPILVLIEDIHWADMWTLDRLAALAGLASECPLLITLTTRFDGDPSLGSWRARLHRTPTTGIDLGPLAPEDALSLTEQFGALPEGTALSYVNRAEGNPLFLEQLLLTAEGVEQAILPGSIQSLVLARMDQLAPGDRVALQAAAVLGQRFSFDLLCHLIEDAEYKPASLVGHFLIRPEGSEYLFCHALIRDGAYESLLKSRRRQLHTRAAEWFGARDPLLAAEHFERAENPEAARAYLSASQSESDQYHYSAALTLAERGLALANTREVRFLLESARARVLNEMGHAKVSIDAWRAALQSAEGGGERCQALIGLAQGMRIVDQSDDGLVALAEAEPLAREARLSLELSRIHHLRGNYYFGIGRGSECLGEHEKALSLARYVGSVEAEANALSGLGDGHYVRGRMRSANEQFHQCVDLAHRHGLGRIEVANKHMVGWSMYYLGELRAPLTIGLESIEMAAKVSHHRVEVIARHLVAYVGGWLMGDPALGLGHLDPALKISQALGAKRFEGQNITYRGLLALRGGDREEAERHAREALRFFREHGMDFFGPVALGLLARLTHNAVERDALNAEAMERLARGAIGHNPFEFHVQAIESALERSAWDEAVHFCAALERHTQGEPLPWSDFLVARGRQLARFGRGARDDALLKSLQQLHRQAVEREYKVMIPGLADAIEICER